jgi:hypothetical protein
MLILVTCCWGQRAPQGAKEAGVEALHVNSANSALPAKLVLFFHR